MAVYLDHAATTPLHPQVKEAMLPFIDTYFGNPSSLHRYGRDVRQALDQAHRVLAEALHTKPSQILFTSGGTEADNLALIGLVMAGKQKGRRRVVTSQIEHHAVLDTCKFLEQLGFEVYYVPVNQAGEVDIDELKRVTTPDTACLSIMYGNNEVGTLQPIEEIGEWARQQGVPFHTDAVQAFGAYSFDMRRLPVDALTLSAHKIGGPKGVGALYLRENVSLVPLLHGGTQERRRRPGTENVLGIVGFAKAVELAMEQQASYVERMQSLQNFFLDTLQKLEVPYQHNGAGAPRLPHILNLSFPSAPTEVMLMNLDLAGIACASGSACTSGTLEVSHVLQAMHLDEERQKTAIRFSFGWSVSQEDLRYTANTITSILQRLQSIHPE
jgi:cysteine desulfurase